MHRPTRYSPFSYATLILCLAPLHLALMGIQTCEEVEIDQDQDGWAIGEGDCDDRDAATYPGADEYCDAKDNDCDGTVDEDAGYLLYPDLDADGYGDESGAVISCETPEGYVPYGGDCDDADATIHPNAEEVCDGVDNDCDGAADELYDSADPDWDDDGLLDACDNCPEAANPGQEDADGDGQGDDCEVVASWSSPAYLTEINTGTEGPPWISADGLTLYFGSEREGGLGNDDLWVATRPDRGAAFDTPTPLGAGVNSSYHDLQPTLTADGLEIIFVRSDGTWGGNDLYRATRTDVSQPFGAAEPLDELNIDGPDSYPCLSPDGLTLYYTSTGSGGDDDIFVAVRPDRSSPFGTPEPFAAVNSSSDDISFFLRADGLMGIVSSRRGTDWQADLFITTRASVDASLSEPALIAELATEDKFESGPSLTADGAELYFYGSAGNPTGIYRSLYLGEQPATLSISAAHRVVSGDGHRIPAARRNVFGY